MTPPACTLALNCGSPSAAYTPRQDEVEKSGARLLRYLVISEIKAALDYAASRGRKIFIVCAPGQLKQMWDLFGDHSGFAKMLEAGNESYLKSGFPMYAGNPHGYYMAFLADVKALMKAHPEAQVLLQGCWQNNPAWIDGLFAAQEYDGQINDLYYGMSVHPYSLGLNPQSASYPGSLWSFNNINAALAKHGLGYGQAHVFPLWGTEGGYSSFTGTGYNNAKDDSGHAGGNPWKTTRLEQLLPVVMDPKNNCEVFALYELTMEPGQKGNEEGFFGIDGHDGHAPEPQWQFMHDAYVANNTAGARIDFGGGPTPPIVIPPVTPPPAKTGLLITGDPNDSESVIFTVEPGTDHVRVHLSDSDAYPLPDTQQQELDVPVPAGAVTFTWHVTRIAQTHGPVWVDGVEKSATNADEGPWYSNHTGGHRVKTMPHATPTPLPALKETIAAVVLYRTEHDAGDGKKSRAAMIAMDELADKYETTFDDELSHLVKLINAYRKAHKAGDGAASRSAYIALGKYVILLAHKYLLPFAALTARGG